MCKYPLLTYVFVPAAVVLIFVVATSRLAAQGEYQIDRQEDADWHQNERMDEYHQQQAQEQRMRELATEEAQRAEKKRIADEEAKASETSQLSVRTVTTLVVTVLFVGLLVLVFKGQAPRLASPNKTTLAVDEPPPLPPSRLVRSPDEPPPFPPRSRTRSASGLQATTHAPSFPPVKMLTVIGGAMLAVLAIALVPELPYFKEAQYKARPLSYWRMRAKDKSAEFRAEAADALGHLEDTPTLLELLRDQDPSVQAAAVAALGRSGAPAIPCLTQLSQDKNEGVRANGMLALAEIGPPAISALTQLSQDKNEGVRASALSALAKIGPPAVPALADLLAGTDDEQEVLTIASLLGGMGSNARSAIPALEGCLRFNKHTDQVGAALWTAIHKIEPDYVEHVEIPMAPAPKPDSSDSGPVIPPGEQTGKPFVLQMTPDVKMEFAWIPPGDYMMGTADGSNGLPRKKVSFDKPFYMAIYEVTQEQWKAVMGGNPSLIRGDKYPVERVSWSAAQEFVRKMNEKYASSAKTFDLPTEAEWEYCSRGGWRMKLNSGDDKNCIDEYAWMGGNWVLNGGPSLHPVGQKKANPWGLYDMQGNVAEWCKDVVSGESDEPMHAVRGGNYHGGFSECLSTSRVPRRDDVKLRADGLRLMCAPTK